MSDLSIERLAVLKWMLKKRCACGVLSTGSGKGTVLGAYEGNNNNAVLCKACYNVVEGPTF